MTTINAIKALKRAGLEVVQSDNRVFAKTSGHTISFIDQANYVICLKVTQDGDVSNSQSDYFAGSYASSMKQALQWAV